MQHTDLDQTIAEVRRRVAELGYELVDLRLGGARQRPRLQVRIDRPDSQPGQGVTVDDCAVVSRALEAWLDGADLFGPRYILEVSSPGIERPVRWPEHWARFVGRAVRVKVPGRGRIRATIVRMAGGDDAVVLRPDGGNEELTVPLAEAQDARLAVDWDATGLPVRDT